MSTRSWWPDAGPDRILCEGESVMIGTELLSNPDLQYLWAPAVGLSSPQVARPLVANEEDQQFVLSVFSGACGPVYDTVYVIVKPKPEVGITPTQSIGPGSSVRLEASGGVSYRWQPAALLDNPMLPDPVATPLSNTLFTVEVVNEFGCIVTDSVMVLIQNVLFIPNLFTPNGDGSNDKFRIYGSGISELQLSIYDLNGTVIHTISDPEEALYRGWDGTRGGTALPNGSYIWTIRGKFYDGSPLEFNGQQRGMISLIR